MTGDFISMLLLLMMMMMLTSVFGSTAGFNRSVVFDDRPWHDDYLSWRQGTDVFVRSYGLSFEWQHVKTEDDCTIALHHVWNSTRQASKVPVLFVHALITDGDSWFISKPSNSLAMVMANNGYDVWALNYRASRYSPIRAEQYVSTTMDDNALKDLPASIDFVLNKTGYQNLNLVSMSKGGYVSLALLSSRPEYNSKVRLHFTMVPVTAVTEPRGWIKYFMLFHRFMIHRLGNLWVKIFNMSHIYFDILHFWKVPLFLQFLAENLPGLLERIVNLLWDAKFEPGKLNMDSEIISKALKRGFPTIWFGREMIQFAQNTYSRQYQSYSSSWLKDDESPFQEAEPFNTSQITAPHMMLESNTEIFSSPADYKRIRNELCSVFIDGPLASKYVFQVDVANYQHVDPIVGVGNSEIYVNAVYMIFRNHDISLNESLTTLLPEIPANYSHLIPQSCESSSNLNE